MFKRFAATLIAGLALGAASAAAQQPSAIVEKVEGNASGVEFMDYLTPGRVIKLEPGSKLVLSYLKSCWRETIEAGEVTVGEEQSVIKDGRFERVQVPCDGGNMVLTAEQASRSGAYTFRAPPGRKAMPKTPITLYGQSPMIEVRGGGKVVIERIDAEGQPIVIEGKTLPLIRGSYYDLAANNTTLTPGGLYRATTGDLSVVFGIDPSAQPGSAPIIGRLLRLLSAYETAATP